ncbi:MAG: hypothetical protein K0S46_2279 [Moraxellaceae bacterium]|jgi:hypothetical protein|nr:hypothetical protein [Moraxellaceae bacterium]
MTAASLSELEALGIRYLDHFDRTRDSSHPSTRLHAVKAAALKLREEILAGKPARYYQTVDLIRVPYPTKYGLLNACTVPMPFMHILNRLFIVQFDSPTGLKTLLFSPSDIDGNRETPYFKRLSESFGPQWLRSRADALMAPIYNRVEDALAKAGLTPADVDYISYDHLHTQDLRRWLGCNGRSGIFPRAKLLVMKQEWDSTLTLLPPQKDWYCPDGIIGIDPAKVVLLNRSVQLGDGVALVATPGHTEGNHSLVVNTQGGLLVSSENGVCADSFSPLNSEIPGVRDYAKATGMEVILNGNTLERGLDQYISMVMEKTIAGPCQQNPDFYNFVPSSEMTAYWALPGLKPTFGFGPLQFGSVTRA